ncbi:hypothetical protein [Lacrimispora brassicae]
MKRMKNMIAGCAAVLVLAAAPVTAFAGAVYETPAEAAAGITGKTLDEVIALRGSGKSYGTIADEAGKLDEFRQAALDIRKEALELKIEDGTLTQEQADAMLTEMAQRQAQCDGTGSGRAGAGLGAGRGCGYGSGAGKQNGSCLYR